MISLLEAPHVAGQGPTQGQPGDLAAQHACLIAEYLAYTQAAGYSMTPTAVVQRERAATSFLGRFPQPESWLALPRDEQLRYPKGPRYFLLYLFLRHILPMPAWFARARRQRLGDMARRLMERDTYDTYHQMAARLGYSELTIHGQFHALVCVTCWAQKPFHAVTHGDIDGFGQDLREAFRAPEDNPSKTCLRDGLSPRWTRELDEVRQVLCHLGIIPRQPAHHRMTFNQKWAHIPPRIANTVHRYLQQMAVVLRPSSLDRQDACLRRFFSWLTRTFPQLTSVAEIQRRHIEAYKEHLRWVPLDLRFHQPLGTRLKPRTVFQALCFLANFFSRITEWGWEDAPPRQLIFSGDFPNVDMPLPRFLDEAQAVRFLDAARNHPDLFTRVCGITLLRTGLRKGEFLALTADSVVQIGGDYWLRVPLGKTHRDRYVPLHQEVKSALDAWVAHCQPQRPTDFLFTHYGHPMGSGWVDTAVSRIAAAANIPGKVTPHRLRHTLATLAINQRMPLESIAALLGHRSLSMTLVYARIGQRSLQQEYAAVSQRLENLCGATLSPQPTSHSLPQAAEGPQMRRLRHDIHWRLLGNGYCTRPDGVPCDYETICESCPCFFTTGEFLPALHQQKEDAESKGHDYRARVLRQLIRRVEEGETASDQSATLVPGSPA